MSGRRYSISARPERVEHRLSFECFGGTCTVIVADALRCADAAEAAAAAKRSLLRWHARFSRFEDDSEPSRFNADPRSELPVSPMLRRLIEVAIAASRDTAGLVDATLGAEIERAGYASHFAGPGLDFRQALRAAPPPRPASGGADSAENRLSIDPSTAIVRRRPGTVFDPGGIAKGVFADQLAATLAGFDAFVIDCAGDLRVGGRAGLVRPVHISSPLEDRALHTFQLREGGVATSGIAKRSWLDGDARPAHHLLDPRTGSPAFTGVVQATALAPTAAQAEVLAKAALLSGPGRAPDWLVYGGAFVRDDGDYEVLDSAGESLRSSTDAPTRRPSHASMSSSTSSRSGSLRISW